MVSSQAWAVIYKYIDAHGTPTYVDDLHLIPEQHRKTAVLVSGEYEQDRHASTSQRSSTREGENEDAASGPRVALAVGGRNSFSGRLARSILILFASIAAYFGAVEVLAKKNLQKHQPFVKAAVIVIASASVLYLHALDIVRGVFSVGSAIQEVKEESAEKGKRTATFIKALDKVSSGTSPMTAGEKKAEEESVSEGHP